jgi:hypothetical protein
MSKYTIELRNVIGYYTRDVVESWFKNYNIEDYLTPEQIQVVNQTGLWNKNKLAKKIVDHYFMREIGFETPALFEHYAKVTMEEIMEEKLPLIYSASIKYDPLVNVDYTETFERSIDSENSNSGTLNSTQNSQTSGTGSNSGSSSSTSNSLSENMNIENKTPQTKITKQNLDSGIYASTVSQGSASTNVTDSTTTQNSQTTSSTGNDQLAQSTSSSGENSTDENYTKHVKGNSGVSATAQKMVEQFRDNIRAIDKEIIEELHILFMGLY